jgi:radical SAM superfamily enzyme YgiQ (UPF0313 family)
MTQFDLSTYRGFEQGPIRPPSEARSLLIRVTRNCPWNRCRFCPVYKGTEFSRRPLAHVLADIEAVAQAIAAIDPSAVRLGVSPVGFNGSVTLPEDPNAALAAWNWYRNGMRSVFLQDANPLAVPAKEMLAILGLLRERFPSIERITTYARSRTVARITQEDLNQMRLQGLDRVHIGFESGSDEVLRRMDKGVTKAVQVEAGRKVKAAGMELSAYYMPGLGGRELWRENALETADLMNQVDPDFIRLRTLAVPDRAALYDDMRAGRFVKANDVETAREILLFLENLEGISSTIVSDHVLNLFEDLNGKLPEDKERLVAELQAFLALDPDEQLLYRVGRRCLLFAGLADLKDPRRRDRAERLVREFGVTPENVDTLSDRLVERFI